MISGLADKWNKNYFYNSESPENKSIENHFIYFAVTRNGTLYSLTDV